MKAALTHSIFTIGSGHAGTGVRLIPGEHDRWVCIGNNDLLSNSAGTKPTSLKT